MAIDTQALGDLDVLDVTGATVRVGSAWATGPAVLVFLRHFGWLFCREHAAEFRPHEEELRRLGAKLVFVSTGTPAMALDFQGLQGFGATTWVDPGRRTYRHLGFKRGPGSTLLNLATLGHALRAWRKGFRQGATQGDPWQQGGVLVVRAGGEAVLCFAAGEAGDLAPTADVMAAARRAAQRP